MPKQNINEFDRNNNNAGKESKTWKGIKQDSSGKYLVYITNTNERLFDNLDQAVQYLKEAAMKEDIKIKASSENAVVQRGQENLDGLKEVITRRKLVQTADGKYKVMESKRYNMKSDDSNDAKNKLLNIDRAKEQTEELPQDDAFKDIKDEISGTEGKKQKRDLSHKTSALQYGPVGTCMKCKCKIYPPNTDMDYWFNRQLPADLYCPVCGYGIGTPGNFNYDNAKMNEQSVDNLVKVYGGTKKTAGITEEDLQKAKDDPHHAYYLMSTNRLTVYDPEFSELLDLVLQEVDYSAPWLLKLGIVTPDDPYYEMVLKKALEDKTIATLLITTNIVKKDNPYFGMVLRNVDPKDYDHIMSMGYVTKDELEKFLAF